MTFSDDDLDFMDDDDTWRPNFYKKPPYNNGLYKEGEDIENKPHIQRIVGDRYRFKKFNSVKSFIDYYLNLSDKVDCYETIPGNNKQKPHFDIAIARSDDIAEEHGEVLNSLINSVDKVFKDLGLELNFEKGLLLFHSNGDCSKKYSYHVIIDNYYHENNLEAKAFYDLVITNIPDKYKKFIDPAPYSKLQEFRLIGSYKHSLPDRVKTPILEYTLNGKNYNYNGYPYVDDDYGRKIVLLLNSLICIYPLYDLAGVYTPIKRKIQPKINKTPNKSKPIKGDDTMDPSIN